MNDIFSLESVEADDLEPVEFYSEDIEFELNNPARSIIWIENLVKAENKNLIHLSFIFCNDAYLFDLNVQYLDHDTLTDIITFQYSKLPDVEGDIFISLERVQENANTYGVTFEEELYRVMAHGVMHLCGYGDKTTEEKTKMTEKENEALTKWRVSNTVK